MSPRRVVVLLAIFGMTVACGIDGEQARVCERLIPAFEPDARDIDILGHGQHGSADNSIVVRYRVRDADGRTAEHWIGCWFEASAFGPGRLSVQGVDTDRHGLLSPVKLQMLRIWSRLDGGKRPPKSVSRW
jgi:branched-chain amino acid transport system permease protein